MLSLIHMQEIETLALPHPGLSSKYQEHATRPSPQMIQINQQRQKQHRHQRVSPAEGNGRACSWGSG